MTTPPPPPPPAPPPPPPPPPPPAFRETGHQPKTDHDQLQSAAVTTAPSPAVGAAMYRGGGLIRTPDDHETQILQWVAERTEHFGPMACPVHGPNSADRCVPGKPSLDRISWLLKNGYLVHPVLASGEAVISLLMPSGKAMQHLASVNPQAWGQYGGIGGGGGGGGGGVRGHHQISAMNQGQRIDPKTGLIADLGTPAGGGGGGGGAGGAYADMKYTDLVPLYKERFGVDAPRGRGIDTDALRNALATGVPIQVS